jgi:tRNA nucleotidyltransferase/poly(A) polymerase
VILKQPLGEKFVMLALQNTDQRIHDGKSASPAFLFAALLWHHVLSAWKVHQDAGERPIAALHAAMDEVLSRQQAQLAIPRRYDAVMKDLWLLQPVKVARWIRNWGCGGTSFRMPRKNAASKCYYLMKWLKNAVVARNRARQYQRTYLLHEEYQGGMHFRMEK